MAKEWKHRIANMALVLLIVFLSLSIGIFFADNIPLFCAVIAFFFLVVLILSIAVAPYATNYVKAVRRRRQESETKDTNANL